MTKRPRKVKRCPYGHPKTGVSGGVWMCPECKQVVVFKDIPMRRSRKKEKRA